MLSPSETGSCQYTGAAGYISYQAVFTGEPLEQSVCTPACSTVREPQPSSPTQGANMSFLERQTTCGSVHEPVILVKLPWVT